MEVFKQACYMHGPCMLHGNINTQACYMHVTNKQACYMEITSMLHGNK